MTDLLAKSLNIGAATIAIEVGPTRYYMGLEAFGLGQPTGIDLEGEISGTILEPGDENWFESTLATNAYGQGMAVTPLQLITAVGAIANDGLLVQPHIMAYQHNPNDDYWLTSEPTVIGRAVSAETARS
jgi:cell division protein FtsI/penicillin-binding protein 2